ncbi:MULTISPECIES: carbohydrate ABC transporter permease [unclassified Paenibacillus]|uniref:carbohydrate ABC transporter permease n=1 Tax=unclassified Paenibacillus TaxID=185978 RepID=UPI0009553F75|nr:MULTISPECIES: carbohydrate ABC transporter permease [unclassified Paenibacillus]ASS66130.1 carbohydrate ABC transporter permease [Paenibacillus sp. RUD330]SIQ11699.1 multiple sugar transport system permease protein [Paenibacillus sp. RU4X]SIQ33130.1 multiple sugar transport system permease protein [Paenibacillus sp. RU4T]
MSANVWLQKAGKQAKGLLWGRRVQKAKMIVLGRSLSDGLLAKLVIYALLSIVAYLYLQPLLYMVSTMLKDMSDLLDPTVKWIPRAVTWENLSKAVKGLQYPEALRNTTLIALSCSLAQVLLCAMTGYALARLAVPFKGLITALVILTFLIPPQVIIIPLYVIFSKLGLLNTLFVFLVPALFGQGLKGALFILIFRQFFRAQPASLEEAAKLDGASSFRLFFRIMLPLAQSACLVVFLFSFIWYWNMYYEPSMFLANGFTPLSIRLDNLEDVLNPSLLGNTHFITNPVTEGTKMAAAFLIILPPLLIFMVLQRWFVAGIERTGIVE